MGPVLPGEEKRYVVDCYRAKGGSLSESTVPRTSDSAACYVASDSRTRRRRFRSPVKAGMGPGFHQAE
jgi:hypothetical protein